MSAGGAIRKPDKVENISSRTAPGSEDNQQVGRHPGREACGPVEGARFASAALALEGAGIGEAKAGSLRRTENNVV